LGFARRVDTGNASTHGCPADKKISTVYLSLPIRSRAFLLLHTRREHVSVSSHLTVDCYPTLECFVELSVLHDGEKGVTILEQTEV
jgi:hypothetical protein